MTNKLMTIFYLFLSVTSCKALIFNTSLINEFESCPTKPTSFKSGETQRRAVSPLFCFVAGHRPVQLAGTSALR